MATSVSERKFLYDLLTELRRRYAAAKTKWQEVDRPQHVHFGFDPSDEEIAQRERHYAEVSTACQTTMQVCEAMWNYTKSKYSDWDIELALQENEGRIGTLRYVSDTPLKSSELSHG